MRKLKNFRKKYNLTQNQVANKLGTTQATVSSWELNKTTPNKEFYKKLNKLIREYNEQNFSPVNNTQTREEQETMNNTTIKVDGNTIEVIENKLNLSDIYNKEEWSSLELVEVINYFRGLDGKKSELRHDTLLNILRDEFSEEISLQNILERTYTNSRGQTYPMYNLTSSQAKQVLVRESKAVRRAVIQMLEYLEEQHETNVVAVVLDKQEAYKLENSFVNETINKMAQLLMKMDSLHEKKAMLIRMANIIEGSQNNLPTQRNLWN